MKRPAKTRLMRKLPRPWARSLSGLSINLSAASFAAAYIVPNFGSLTDPFSLAVLTADITNGISAIVIKRQIGEISKMTGQDFLNINANAQIGLALTLIAFFLFYIAFYRRPAS